MKLLRKLKHEHCGKIYYFIIYSFIWFFFALLLYMIFRANNKSFLWQIDGVYQHFVSFNYLCDYLSDIFIKHEIPAFFNFTLGQGADIIITLNSYDFTDPICIFSALIFLLSPAARYTLMIFTKLFLAGLAFSFYCYSSGHKDKTAVLAGTIAYTFSGAILFTFARHPNYINWAYFLPFLLGGVEIYCRKKRSFPLFFL